MRFERFGPGRRWRVGRSAWNGGLNPPGLIVERQSVVDGLVEVSGRLAGAFGQCPDCGTPSSSCHSRYVRTLSDLPISGAVVKLRLSVRRFRCKLRSCRRRTFSEALAPSLGRRHGRRVARCEGLLRAVGLALGGRPGACQGALLRTSAQDAHVADSCAAPRLVFPPPLTPPLASKQTAKSASKLGPDGEHQEPELSGRLNSNAHGNAIALAGQRTSAREPTAGNRDEDA
jgi:hypothetical protein